MVLYLYKMYMYICYLVNYSILCCYRILQSSLIALLMISLLVKAISFYSVSSYCLMVEGNRMLKMLRDMSSY